MTERERIAELERPDVPLPRGSGPTENPVAHVGSLPTAERHGRNHVRVEAGGTLIVSPDSLVGDEYARPFQGARLPGVRVTRTEPQHLKRGETVVTDYNREDLPRMQF